MFTAWGPALDAELSYRRERLAGATTLVRGWWRRRAAVPPVPAAGRWPTSALVEVGSPARTTRDEGLRSGSARAA